MKILPKLPFRSGLVVAVTVGMVMIACQKEKIETQEPVPTLINEAQSARLEQVAQGLAAALNKPEVRKLVHREAWRQFDGDHDVLFARHKDAPVGEGTFRTALAEGLRVNLSRTARVSAAAALQEVDETLKEFPLLNISVPAHLRKWTLADTKTPLVAVCPVDFDEKKTTQVKAFDAEGNMQWLDTRKMPDFPVIVVGQNERVTWNADGSYQLKHGISGMEKLQSMRVTDLDGCDRDGDFCNPYSCMYNEQRCEAFYDAEIGEVGETNPPPVNVPCGIPHGSNIYLKGFKSSDISAIESWIKGKPEIRMKIYIVTQSNQESQIYGGVEGSLWPPKRAWVDNNWWYLNEYLFHWGSSYGDVVNVALWEDDGGSQTKNQNISISGKFGSATYTVTIPISLFIQDEYIGTFPVDRANCLSTIIYGNYTMYFKLDYT